MKTQVGVIGLGKFGVSFGKHLMDLGHEVLGVDISPDKVHHARHDLTQVFQADAMSREVLEQIRFKDLGHVVISVGDSITASVMIAMYLKESGVEKVWAKAVHEDHQKLLLKVGVDEVFIPEFMASEEIASRIAMPGFIEYLPFDETMAVKELVIKKWAGVNLKDLNLTNNYRVQVIATRRLGGEKYQYIPRADESFQEGDSLVLVGEIATLENLES